MLIDVICFEVRLFAGLLLFYFYLFDFKHGFDRSLVFFFLLINIIWKTEINRILLSIQYNFVIKDRCKSQIKYLINYNNVYHEYSVLFLI